MKRTYHITYDIVTPESAEDGDYAESGWVDAHGWDCQAPDDCIGQACIDWCATQDLDHVIEPDEYDIEENDGNESAAAVALMVKTLRDEGATEYSSSVFDVYSNGWYTSYHSQDMRDGSYRSESFHLDGVWTEAERRTIFEAMRRP